MVMLEIYENSNIFMIILDIRLIRDIKFTSNLRFFRQFMKEKIWTDVKPYHILNIWDCFWSDKDCGAWGLVIFNFLREELFLLNTWAIFCWLLFFVGINLHTKTNQKHAWYWLLQSLTPPPPPKSKMSSPVVKITEWMMGKKSIKTKIGVGSVVKANVREMEEKMEEGRSRRTRKDMVVCVHAVVG